MDKREIEIDPGKVGVSESVGEVAAPAAPVRRKSVFREYVEAIGVAILLALVIRTLVVQAFTIPSGSMMDSLLIGDYILVNKFLYGAELPFTDYRMPGFRDPQRGDIIVFRYPQDEKRDFIKRIVATPGERVQVRGHRVYIDGRLLDEPYARGTEAGAVASGQQLACGYAYGCEPLTVPPDSYFVMGDNRNNSQDSRYWGFVRKDKIKGKAFLIYWSWDGERYWLRWWRLLKYVP
jgi:signal peptidase I